MHACYLHGFTFKTSTHYQSHQHNSQDISRP